MTTIDIESQIVNNFRSFINDINLDTTLDLQVNGAKFLKLYDYISYTYDVYKKINNTINICILSYNIYIYVYLHNTNDNFNFWNYRWLIHILAICIICVNKTNYYKNIIQRLSDWISGWNNRKNTKRLLLSFINKTTLNVVTSIYIVMYINWTLSPITWLIYVPFYILYLTFNVLCLYMLNLIYYNSSYRNTTNSILEYVCKFLDAHQDNIYSSLVEYYHDKSLANLVETDTYIESKSCTICMQDDCANMAQLKQCKHIFCYNCLHEWYNESTHSFKCPLCRVTLDKSLNNMPIIFDILMNLIRNIIQNLVW